MNTILVTTPAPACILPITHPARAYIDSSHTDVAATFAQHAPYPGDDYGDVERTAYLEQLGGFK